MSQLQQQLAEAHTAAAQAARAVAAATEASNKASAALTAAEADCAQLQQQLSEVQGQVHSKDSELALVRECMEACKGSLQQQVAGLQAELQQQRSRSEALQVQCEQAARSRERELAQVGPLSSANALLWTFTASSGAVCLARPDRLCVVNSHGKAASSLPGPSTVAQPEQASFLALLLAGAAGCRRAPEGAHSSTVTAAAGGAPRAAGG